MTTADLRERIVRSLVATLGPMLETRTSEHLYVVALTTDSDVITVRLTAHTEQALAGLLGDKAENVASYRWWPDEWTIADDGLTPDDGVEPLAECSDRMYELSEAAPDHDQWLVQAREMLDEALADPRVTKRLAELNPGWKPVFFVTDTDGDLDRTVASIDALNANSHQAADARAYFTEAD